MGDYTKILEKHLNIYKRKLDLAYLVLEKYDLEQEYFDALEDNRVGYEK